MDLDAPRAMSEALREQVKRVIVGHERAMDLLLCAFLCDGHVLLEGVPGTAKTLLAQTFAASVSLKFGRIQFTPDLMPGDVLGTNLFNFESNRFVLRRGPIFTQILLADEINRTPPKTQAALLQAMQERTVTIDGTTYELDEGFMVVATQNPIEQEGTYPLPEAQLDRFLFKIQVGYPERDAEREMVRMHGRRTGMPDPRQLGVEPVCGVEELLRVRKMVEEVTLSDDLVDYIVDVVRRTREHTGFHLGASPRSANMLATAARAVALLDGREYVIPDDIKKLVVPALKHRVMLSPSAEIEGVTADTLLRQILDEVKAPR